MPKLDGFEVLELLDPGVAVVFVTAYDSHALRAFEVHAVDYVLKPFRAERLREALARARERVGQRPEPALLAHAARRAGEHAQRVVVRDGSRIHLIPVARLDYAQAQDDYVALRSEGKTYLKTQTLGSLAASLDRAEGGRHRAADPNRRLLGDAARRNHLLEPPALARGDCACAGGFDHGDEVAWDDEERAPHAEHAHERPLLVQLVLDVRGRDIDGACPHGEEDGGRVGRVERDQAPCGLERGAGRGGRYEPMAEHEPHPPLLGSDALHAALVPP